VGWVFGGGEGGRRRDGKDEWEEGRRKKGM
jgi:hypothetical protein